MIDRRTVNEFLDLYPWNSVSMTIDIPEESVRQLKEATIRILGTPKGSRFFDYLRGIHNTKNIVSSATEVFKVPRTEQEITEWVDQNLAKEDLIQLGMVGFLMPRLWAIAVVASLKGELGQENSGIPAVLPLLEDIKGSSYLEDSIAEFKELPEYPGLKEEFGESPELAMLFSEE